MSDPHPMPPEARPAGAAFWVAAGLALAAQLAVGFPYLASGLLAPGWAVLLLLLGWVVLTVAWALLARRHSWWNLAVPVVSLGTWYAALTLGERLLDWTA